MKSSQASQPRNEALRDSTKTIPENQTNKRLTEAVPFPPSLSPLPERDEYCSFRACERKREKNVESERVTSEGIYREYSRDTERERPSFFLFHTCSGDFELLFQKGPENMDFIKVRRRISYRERMAQLLRMISESPTREVSLKDLVKKWQLSPNYVRRLMRWAAERYDHVVFDENYGVLFLRSEASPVYGFRKAQTKLVEDSP